MIPSFFGGGFNVTEMIFDRSTSRGRPDRGSSINPSIPSASYLARHDVTVGRDTPTRVGDLGVTHPVSGQQNDPRPLRQPGPDRRRTGPLRQPFLIPRIATKGRLLACIIVPNITAKLLTGNVLALKALLPQLKAAKKASVVVVTSVDAGSAEQQLAAYASSKAALTMGVQTIALDYARTGINFNLLAPGPMRAGLFERHLASAADPAQFLATREARQPIGRIIGADEVANAALFLLTDQASALFATTVTADGGLTASFDYRTGAEGSSA